MSGLSISNNVFDLLLRVIAFAHMIAEFVHAIRSQARELWIFFYFNAPALVFGQVPMQDIHFVKRQSVYVLFHGSDIHEMSSAVEQHSAMRINWRI